MSPVANPACANCGDTLVPGDTMCRSCGTPVSVRTAAAALSPTPGGVISGGSNSFSWDTVVARLRMLLRDEFEIITELGRGGMAAVHLATEYALNRSVALKVMSPSVMLGDGMIERFQQEAVTHANLSHPNIVAVHGVRQVEDLYFFVMQYIPGRSMQQVVRSEREAGRALPVDVIRAVLFQVGSALAYAHRRGVIHRDVKPANILLSGDGDAIVTDFGIAKVSESQSNTLTGTVVGTPQYMSPEQCYAAELTGSSDQYSLGIVAYELLTGRPPFTGNSFAVMQAHTLQAPAPITALRPDCPPALEQAVLRMLGKKPGDRFPSIPEALQALGAHPMSSLEGDPVRMALVSLAAVDEVRRRLLDGVRSPLPGAFRRTPSHATPTYPSPPQVPAGRRERAVSAADTTDPLLRRPVRVVLGGAKPFIEVGEELQLSAVARSARDEPVDDVAVRWSSSDPRVARIDPARGVLTGTAPGHADVVATAGDAVATTRVEVRAAQPAEIVAQLPTEVEVGDTIRCSAEVRDARGRAMQVPVQWSGADATIAQVDATGSVAARKPGTARLTARAGSATASWTLKVLPTKPAKVRVTVPMTSLGIGEQANCSATVSDKRDLPLRDATVAWASSDPRIASVNAAGQVTGVAAGTVVISARAGTEVGEVQLVVGVVPLARLDVEGLTGPIKAGATRRVSALAIDRDGRVRTIPISWSSSNPDVGEVEASGLLRAKSPGETVITVQGGTVQRSFPVTVERVVPISEKMGGAVSGAGRFVNVRALAGIAGVAVVAVAGFLWFRGRDAGPTGGTDGPDREAVAQQQYRAAVDLLGFGDTAGARDSLLRLTAGDSTSVTGQARGLLATLDSIRLAGGDDEERRRDSSANANLLARARSDSVARARNDSLARARTDSLARIAMLARARQDSINRANAGKSTTQVTVAIAEQAAPIEVGEPLQLNARVEGGARGALQWTSLDPSVVTVDANGMVRGEGPGAGRVVAQLGTVRATTVVTVVAPAVATIRIEGLSRLTVGTSGTYRYRAASQRGAPVTPSAVAWRSSNERIATVSPTGTVRAIAPGTVEISVAADRAQDSFTLVVEGRVVPPPPPETTTTRKPDTVVVTRPAFTAELATAAAQACAQALAGGSASVASRFSGPNVTKLRELLSRQGAQAAATPASHRTDASGDQVTITFPASASYRNNFGRTQRVDFQVAAVAELQNNRWEQTGCRIPGSPRFP